MFDPSAQYELSICPKGRRPADEYYHQGQVWIEGRENSTYTLRFTNRSSARVLAIFSVDGLDVLKGKPAGHLSEGYVVNGNSTLDIPGWKLDNSTAAEFYFSRSSKSYVAKIGGNVANTGVIGAMVFKEAQLIQLSTNLNFASIPTVSSPYPNWGITGSGYDQSGHGVNLNSLQVGSVNHNAVRGSSMAIAQNSVQHDIGTGFGQATQWNTVSTVFTRENATIPNVIMAIYYDSAKNLQKMGIAVKSRYTSGSSNNPFPAYTASSGVVPPPGWKP